jgi:protein-S-isoprenylcysteine O-methyltransferase Ste14
MRFGFMWLLLHLAWIMAILYASIPSYWLLVHPFSAHWRSRRRSPFRVLVPAWIAMWLVLAAITLPWHWIRLYQSSFAWLAALAFFIAAISTYRRTGRDFGRDNLIGQTELRASSPQRLVTTGMHARVRHPIYLAHLCMLLGWTVGSGLLVDYALLIFALVTGALMIRTEERELEGRFGDQFHNYRTRVPAILPSRVPKARHEV